MQQYLQNLTNIFASFIIWRFMTATERQIEKEDKEDDD
jgi:hypothetical protein